MSSSSVKKIALIYSEVPRHADLLNARRDEKLAEALAESGHIEVTAFARPAMPDNLDDYDLVVAAGGDGTMLAVSRCVDKTPVLGVRLYPETSVGFLCALDYDAMIRRLKCGEFDPASLRRQKIVRFQCRIDGIKAGAPVLNDLLFAQTCPARASRYELRFGSRRQIQCSSGIWIATAAGSHGAVSAAGGSVLDIDDRRGAFCVRELCRVESGAERMSEGVFDPNADEFSVVPLSGGHAVYTDGGFEALQVSEGSAVTVTRSSSDLIRLCL